MIAAFVVIGALRLNDCDLFNPDSPRYVIYSQSIVNFGEYRAIDLPGAPVYTWRPPGLSLLLTPAQAIRPYDTVAAKIVILITAALLLWSLYQLTTVHCGSWWAIIVVGLITTNPGFLVLSTEVLSEIPYTLLTLVVLALLCRSASAADSEDDLPICPTGGWAAFGLAIIALTFLPWIRTAGVALVVAVGLWSVTSRPRWKWLTAVIVASLGLGALAWRNHLADGENYAGSLVGRFRERGLIAMAQSGSETISFYIMEVPNLLLPGLSADRPWYAPLTVNVLPSFNLPYAVTATLATILVCLSVLGMWQRRSAGGSLVLLYLLIYSACLVVWPWRHERFLWPLAPVLLAFVPAGINAIVRALPQLERDLSICAAISLLALCGWQGVTCEQLVRENQAFVGNRADFYGSHLPTFYFSNWRRAGEWLNRNSAPTDRILTWHAAVGTTSRRFQKRVAFEATPPDKLRQQIEAFSARYLVIPAGQFGDGFGWQQLAADPVYRFNIVYFEQDVAILEITPNRTGEVSKTTYSDWLQAQVRAADEACKRYPKRIDLAIRRASLLRESGREVEAIEQLRALIDAGNVTVRAASDLGWALFETGQYTDAAKYLDLARTLPNAESIAGTLTKGAEIAIQRSEETPAQRAERDADRQLSMTKALLNNLKLADAERRLDQFLIAHPDQAEALYLRGRLHYLCGNLPSAQACYEHATALASGDAQAALNVLRLDRAIRSNISSTITSQNGETNFDPADPRTHFDFAELLTEQGWSGRALDVLEKGLQKFPDDPTIKRRLADAYRRFARADLAVPIYESLLADNPGDVDLSQGLNAALAAMRVPLMGPIEAQEPSQAAQR